ncbi:putative glucomannan 4-beta-mannosyltransferase [Helianthus anomalus]
MLRFLIDSCFNCSIDSLCVQRLLRLPLYNLRLPLYNRTPVVSISQTKSNPEFEIPVVEMKMFRLSCQFVVYVLLLIGDSGVGRSCLLLRFAKGCLIILVISGDKIAEVKRAVLESGRLVSVSFQDEADSDLLEAAHEGAGWSHYFRQLQGAAGVWRLKAIEDVSGWKDRTTMEDMDHAVWASLNGSSRRLFPTVCRILSHTKVVVTENNRTKSILVGLHGVVKKAAEGLRGWRSLSTACDTNCDFVDVYDYVLRMGFGFLATLAGLTWLYFGIKKRNLVKLRQKMFQRNDGLLLQRRELFQRKPFRCEPFRPEPVPTFIQLCIFLISVESHFASCFRFT